MIVSMCRCRKAKTATTNNQDKPLDQSVTVIYLCASVRVLNSRSNRAKRSSVLLPVTASDSMAPAEL